MASIANCEKLADGEFTVFPIPFSGVTVPLKLTYNPELLVFLPGENNDTSLDLGWSKKINFMGRCG